MTTATHTRRRRWSVAEWSDFAGQCRDVRRQVEGFIRALPPTPGVRAPQIDAILAVRDRLATAMIGMESDLVDQHPDRDGVAVGFIHGSPSSRVLPTADRGVGGPLSRRQWIDLGDRAKGIKRGLVGLLMRYQDAVPKAKLHRLRSAERAMGKACCLLDSVVCRQHPDWPDAIRVFYGAPLADPGNKVESIPFDRS